MRTVMSWRIATVLVVGLSLVSCAGTRPQDLGTKGGRLAPCPDSPNCVSSDAEAGDEVHHIAALVLSGDAADGWRAARETVAGIERTTIVSEPEGYLHAECTSATMRYVDDLELHLRADQGIIAVRSASRVGYGDMGVNRARVEALRARLAERGVVEGG